MNQETFQIFLWVMSAVALVVFIALYFVKAGYGMFRTASWGISINNKLAWVLMEAPVFIVMFGLWGKSGAGFTVPVYFFFLLFQLHYLQRAFIFPFLLKGKSRMPVAIMAMGIVFNLLNGMMQAGGLFYFAPEGLYADGWAYLLKPHALLGIILFFAGMFVNLHSDSVIRHLRSRVIRSTTFPEKDFTDMSLLPIISVSWWNGRGLPYSQLPLPLGCSSGGRLPTLFPVPMPFTAVIGRSLAMRR